MSPVVRVEVLEVTMSVISPAFSTAWSFLMRMLSSLRLSVEKLEAIETATGSPSGIITSKRVTAMISRFIILCAEAAENKFTSAAYQVMNTK
jgi:hypothetical protein